MSTNPLAPPSPDPAALASGDPYRRALARLFERTGGTWRLGLERVEALMAAVGSPHRGYPVFHVAGTNGKGSTIATLDALLRAGGLRVGRYTSPHLVDFSERIVVDDVPVSHQAIMEWLDAHDGTITELGATFFEATTALALSHFARAQVDVAVVEVGLGGRLDATNVVRPVAAAVTQIGIDHVEYLGHRLEDIAGEKAGIFKPGVAAVIGERDPAIRDLLTAHAETAGASPVLVTGRDWDIRDIEVTGGGTDFAIAWRTEAGWDPPTRLHTPLVGPFQAHNAGVALAMLRGAGGPWAGLVGGAAAALPTVRLAGRFHRSGKWLFDVAHNADGAATVAANLQRVGVPGPIVAVVSVLRDKDWQGILRAVAGVAERVFVTTAPTSPASRTWNLEEAVAWGLEAGLPVVGVARFEDALSQAEAVAGTVLVTGSFHTVGDAMERLQVPPLVR